MSTNAAEHNLFCNLKEYRVLPSPVSQRVRKGFKIFSHLTTKRKGLESPFENSEDLLVLPASVKKRLTLSPDWQFRAENFAQAISGWLKDDSPSYPVIFLVMPPYYGREELLKSFSELCKWKYHKTPVSEDLAERARLLIQNIKGNDEKWILEDLEHLFLRDSEGLIPIRSFLTSVITGELGKGIIGCSSWAWEYLKHIAGLNDMNTITMKPFDSSMMQEVVNASSKILKLSLRQSDNGSLITIPEVNAVSNGDSSYTESNYLQRLSLYSRGHAIVSNAIWQDSLRMEKDEENISPDGEQDVNDVNTVWVKPLATFEPPILPIHSSEEELLLLHALLIHNGLDSAGIFRILPICRFKVTKTLSMLKASKVLDFIDEKWLIRPQSYPAVRDFVAINGYLRDRF